MIGYMTKLKRLVLGKLPLTFGLAFLGLMIVAALMLAGQCYVWFKYGYWEPYSLSGLLLDLELGVPKAPRFAAVQKTIDLVLSLPATACLAAAAALCFLIGGFFTKLANRELGER
jgi:hypothetical protein